jgi:hypothetical protein
MAGPFDGALTFNPRYYEIRGRAAEIARALGSRVGGAEHLFLGMLHDGGWPVRAISPLADLGRAEAAVLDIINSPGYTPPTPPPFFADNDYVQADWGGDIAVERGDSYIGAGHALLSMIRKRETVPARALASLADLDALEAVVLEAMNAPGGPPADAVFLPAGQELDGPLRQAIIDARPEGTMFGFNFDGAERTWLTVFGPEDDGDPDVTREVLDRALASLGRGARH